MKIKLHLPGIPLALLLGTLLASAEPAPISFTGGDGSSMDKAVVIHSATERSGVHAEYDYLRQHFPGYQKGDQSVLQDKQRVYDVLHFTTADAKKMVIYFDITEFYGKIQ
jgi:hypothetical protein